MSKNWAICIGINGYGNLPSLRYAVRDAEAMRDFLKQEADFDEVFYFSDQSPSISTPKGPMDSMPTFATLRRFFRTRFAQAPLRAGDNLWLFFAGHGKQHNGHDYLLPKDVDPGDIEATALKVSDITAQLQRSGADNTVLLLDACRDQGTRSAIGGFGENDPKGVVTIYSCSPQQPSHEIEELQHGVFTYALLEGFRLHGDRSCATVERIDQHLRYQVPSLSERYKKQVQTPRTSIDPISKKHLILLPRRARLDDVIKLKYEALKAEWTDAVLARRLWVRVLAASSADPEAIEAIERIVVNRVRYPVDTVSEPATAGSRSIEAPVSEASRTADRVTPKPTFEFEVVTVDAKGAEVRRDRKTAEYRREDLGNGITLDLVTIPGGTFQMGSSAGKGDKDEYPQHRVSVKPFLMAKYQVTQAQWRAVVNLPKVEQELYVNPSRFEGNDHPVECVSWDDAVEFCQRLSTYTGREYRLPTEAEWEYACRAGTTTPFHFGSTLTTDIANYDANYTYGSGPKGNCREQTVDVGSFPANAFGLHDMHGNVWEWCADYWHENYEGAPTDGSAWITGGDESRRLLRGGSWFNNLADCRSALRYGLTRDSRNDSIGFRVVCTSAWTLA